MAYKVSFMDGETYRAAEFRRWFSAQQDGVTGFLTEDCFKVAESSIGLFSVAVGTAFIKEDKTANPYKGMYHVHSDSPATVTHNLGEAFLWMYPVDGVDYPGDIADGSPTDLLRFKVHESGTTPPKDRAILLAKIWRGGVEDMRFAGPIKQFVITRSGPARRGEPGKDVPLPAFADMSLGTQYTDLNTGIRYVRKGKAGTAADWMRDQGPTGQRGPQGNTGPQGLQGIQGVKGEPGDGIIGGLLTATDANITGNLKLGPHANVGQALTDAGTAVTSLRATAARTWFTDTGEAKDGDFLVTI